MRKIAILFALLLAMSAMLSAQTSSQSNILPGCLYKVSFIQAAPGKLLELIDLQKARNANKDYGDEPALWMRHSQGDRWDLMIMYPMGSYSDYYTPVRVAKRTAAAAKDPAASFFL